jgi:hypothetical protein
VTQTYVQALVEEIDTIHRDAVRAGMRADGARGASGDEIELLMHRQRVLTVPVTVRRIWELIGADPGPFWRGSTCAVTTLTAEVKRMAVRAPGAGAHRLADPEGMLVLLEHGGYQFEVVDGADLHLPNPPVWLLCEGGEPLEQRWTSVTSWFHSAGRGVARSKLRFDEHIRRGGRDSQGARHFH